MIEIVGGAYLESCREPEWYELFGSGVRAAAVLAAIPSACRLHTYMNPAWQTTLAATGEAYGFGIVEHPSTQTPHFEYQYPVSKPDVIVAPEGYEQVAGIEVVGEVVLRFGMLEKEGVVRGRKVVYDPQAETRPKQFDANGSTAESLAIVANEAEVVALTNRRDPRDAALYLIERVGAEVVVVKRGARGAMVRTRDELNDIPSYRTPNVWPIGSGDIFSALFTHYWAVSGCGATEAATRASRGTALYCNSKVVPQGQDLTDIDPPGFDPVFPVSEDPPQVYLAGPFFSLGERWVVEEVRRSLGQQGVRVFSPLHDVGFGDPVEIAEKDLVGLTSSQAVFAILDGCDPGTIFEVGFACARGIPVVVWTERASERDLLMLRGSGCTIVSDLSTAIYHSAWAAFKESVA